MANEKWYTLQQVAQQLQVNEKTIRRLIKSGRLPASRVGNRIRIAKSDVQEYMRSTRQDHATNDGK